jgi:hypothetical protein
MTRTKDKPTVVRADRFDDTRSIGNVSQMYSKLVVPIDQEYRSIANSPGLGTKDTTTRATNSQQEDVARKVLTGQEVDADNFVESRTHAFYRMVGLPVVSQDGFYNSGHNPDQGSTLSSRTMINDSLTNKDSDVLTLASLREDNAIFRRKVFNKQDDVSTGYALLLRNSKPFLMAETGKDPFFFDKQSQPIAGRKESIESFDTSDDIKATLKSISESPSHILKPFIVIPAIESAITPNYKKRICVPFLKSIAETKATPNITLKRPIIEYIIRQRLKIKETDDLFLDTARRVIQNSATTSDATSTNIKNALLAISGEATLNDDVLDGIQGFTTVQAATVVLFTKAIQVAVKELDDNIRSFDEQIIKQNIQPIPNRLGPEFGGTIRTIGGIKDRSEADKKIAVLELTRLLAQLRSQDDSAQVGNESSFASAIVADIHKDFDKPIKKLKSERDKSGSIATNNLKVIEVVTGEVSGLGLIDILAIYTALWTIDIGDLIGLLDNDSLSRLCDNFSYLAPIGSEARNQLNAGNRSQNIFTVLTNLETRIFNILTYADGVLVKTRQGPRRSRKGTV